MRLPSTSLVTDGIAELEEIGAAFAGVPFMQDCGPGQCVRIMTGALIPAGTDTVVMQEQVEVGETAGFASIPIIASAKTSARPVKTCSRAKS